MATVNNYPFSAGKLTVKPLRREDFTELTWLKLREIDKKEIRDMSGRSPWRGLLYSCLASEEAYKVVNTGGESVAVFGLGGNDTYAVPWMLGTPLLSQKRYAKDAAYLSKHVVNRMQKRHPYLGNFVHKDNKRSIRWLRWLGFTVDTDELRFGNNFYYFHLNNPAMELDECAN